MMFSNDLASALEYEFRGKCNALFPFWNRTAHAQAAGGNRWVVSRTRRMVDFIFALLALLVTLPVILVVALAVRVSSRGPVLFRQRRLGRSGREFVLLKFRSMEVSASTGAFLTVAGDARVTQVGSILRRWKLDELPQFWNVMKGDMGLVGPRPKLKHLEGLIMPYRPGITGCATLVFRHEEELLANIPAANLNDFYHAYIKPGKVRLDEEYMRNATMLSDLSILFRTAAGVWTHPPKHPLLEQLERKAYRMYPQAEGRRAVSAS
jgi:lipopolysaccharide/colanic/teichoic acid biosynthesis glycosyltransferase